MLTVGICGGTGSGKSTFARTIKNALGEDCLILGQDCYYFDQGAKPMAEREKVNYDEPCIFDHDELLADVIALSEGRSITKKGYDFKNHCRADSDELISPPKILLIEGIHAFYDERLVKLMALRVFMRVDVDLCLLRRIKRDMEGRGRTLESVMEQYKRDVKPMHDAFVSRYESRADIAVMEGGKNAAAAAAVVAYIEKRLDEKGFNK